MGGYGNGLWYEAWILDNSKKKAEASFAIRVGKIFIGIK
jgi:hypothetical protein